MQIDRRKAILKLKFQALALRQSEGRRANAQKFSFRIALRRLIHIVNSKLSYDTTHRYSTSLFGNLPFTICRL